MNVEQLRKQAKELVKDARGGDEDAVVRLGDAAGWAKYGCRPDLAKRLE